MVKPGYEDTTLEEYGEALKSERKKVEKKKVIQFVRILNNGKKVSYDRFGQPLSRNNKIKYPLSFFHARCRLLKVCPACSECGGNTELHIHHKDKDRFNNELNNLQVLCRQCHAKKHKNVAILQVCSH